MADSRRFRRSISDSVVPFGVQCDCGHGSSDHFQTNCDVCGNCPGYHCARIGCNCALICDCVLQQNKKNKGKDKDKDKNKKKDKKDKKKVTKSDKNETSGRSRAVKA